MPYTTSTQSSSLQMSQYYKASPILAQYTPVFVQGTLCVTQWSVQDMSTLFSSVTRWTARCLWWCFGLIWITCAHRFALDLRIMRSSLSLLHLAQLDNCQDTGVKCKHTREDVACFFTLLVDSAIHHTSAAALCVIIIAHQANFGSDYCSCLSLTLKDIVGLMPWHKALLIEFACPPHFTVGYRLPATIIHVLRNLWLSIALTEWMWAWIALWLKWPLFMGYPPEAHSCWNWLQ